MGSDLVIIFWAKCYHSDGHTYFSGIQRQCTFPVTKGLSGEGPVEIACCQSQFIYLDHHRHSMI